VRSLQQVNDISRDSPDHDRDGHSNHGRDNRATDWDGRGHPSRYAPRLESYPGFKIPGFAGHPSGAQAKACGYRPSV